MTRTTLEIPDMNGLDPMLPGAFSGSRRADANQCTVLPDGADIARGSLPRSLAFPWQRVAAMVSPPITLSNVAIGQLPNARFRQGLKYWQDAKGALALPPVEAISPTKLPRSLIGGLCILERDGNLRLRFRLVGTLVAQAIGFDPTGKYADEIAGAEDTNARVAESVRAKLPYYYAGPLVWSSLDYKQYRALVMPFGDAVGTVTRVVTYSEYE
jgi:PAS domain